MKIKREIKFALFGIAVVVFAYWGINFLKGLDLLSRSNYYYVTYAKSDNIEVSSPVLIRGVKVGTVSSVSLPSINDSVTVVLSVRKKYPIPDNSVAMITNKSVLGGKAIFLEVGDSKTFLNDEQHIQGVIDNNVSEQIDQMKDKITGVIDELTTTLSSINKVLNPKTIDNINAAVGNVAGITNDASKTVKDLSGKLALITSDLTILTSELKLAAPEIKRTTSNLAIISDSLKYNLPILMANASRTINEINHTVEMINSRQGTIGLLLHDPQLYNNINLSSENLASLLSNLQEQPSRYVHFSLFGRKDPAEKAKNKAAKKAKQ